MEGDKDSWFEVCAHSCINYTDDSQYGDGHDFKLNSVDEEEENEIVNVTGQCDCDTSDGNNDLLATSSDDVTLKKKSLPKKLESLHLVDPFTGKKPKLRTSKDIYDRLTWDKVLLPGNDNSGEEITKEELDTSTVYIGYKDRFLGMCELPFSDFNPGGDIPFHRIYYFRTGGPPVLPFIGKDGEIRVREENLPKDALFIWDRESRTDLIFNSGNSTVIEKRSSRSRKQKSSSSSHKS